LAFLILVFVTISPALGTEQIWDGEVLLTGGEVNVTGTDGEVHAVDGKSALGALINASETGGFELGLDTFFLDIRGPVVGSIGGIGAEGNKSWSYWVNYPDDPVPLVSPDLFELEDGDKVTFYLGDRHALPNRSPRVNFTAKVVMRRPDVLIISAENHAVINEAAKDGVLNVTLTFQDNFPVNFTGYDLIFLEMIGAETAQLLIPLLEEPKRRSVPIIAIHSSGYDALLGNVDMENHSVIEDYWNYGGQENMELLFSYLGANFCDLDISTKDPIPTPDEYICHPDSPNLFLNTTSYLEWYKNNSGHRYDEAVPTIGIMNLASDPVASPLRVSLVRALEDKGANVIDIGFSNTTSMKNLFMPEGESIIEVVILTKPFRLNYGDPDEGIRDLEELNVPVLSGMKLWYQNPEEWRDATGIYPTEIYFKLAMPEMDGVIEPIVVAGRTNEGIFEPISTQIDWLSERAIAWANLGRKPNVEKKAAIIYYNHGGGKDNLGATYINVPRSLQVILDELNESGYHVEGTIPAERDLVDLMAHEGTNVGTWAPGELERMVAAGNATLLPTEDYVEWFEKIDPIMQKEVTDRWGPVPGEIMVYENESGKYFVIPKLSFGNVILAPQPTRGWLQNNTVLYHRKDIPPHHQYIAFYFWLKEGFDADFIVHLGKHGTQEWTPGKESGISSDRCWPGVLIQDLPVVYPYIVDNIAEGSQAKRRGDAVMITHLTPPIVASGLYGNFTNLADTAFNYNEVENATVKELYKEEIIAGCLEMHLDEDLEVNLTELVLDPVKFDEFVDVLEHYLYDLKNEFMPYGLHTFATPMKGDCLVEMTESMVGQGYQREVALMISYEDYPNPSRLDKEIELENVSKELLRAVLFNETTPENAQALIFGSLTLVHDGNTSVNETYENETFEEESFGIETLVEESFDEDGLENESLVSKNLTAYLDLALVYASGLGACTQEAERFINASASKYTPPSPADDPIRDPEVLPTGRNFHSISPRKVPTPAAWEAGQSLADDLIEQYRADNNGTYPEKMGVILWAWAMTDHGVVESEILHLVGAKPVWDSYGGVCDVELVPLSELGRPKIDVLVVPSGLDRDLFPEKLKLIDKAIRLARNDTDDLYSNYVRENSIEIEDTLIATGNYSEEDAEYLSTSRIFLEAAGTYGPNLDSAVAASDTWENDSKLGNLFIDRMSYIYGDDVWGSKTTSGKVYNDEVQMEVYKLNLAEVDAVSHHTNSNLYGFIDNDDVFQYVGGLGMAVRTVTGETPPMYVTDVRNPNMPKVESLHDFFSKELRTRYYNPKWIEGMKAEGYSGAREMDRFVEFLWGWEVTTPDLVTEATWNEVYDVYVNDKYDMGLDEFFDQNNPYAFQVMSARMLETSRKERWHPTEEMKQELAERFEESEMEYGVTCCHHTCGNIFLREYMEGVLTGSEPEKSSSSGKGGGASRHPYVKETGSGITNQTQSSGVGKTSPEKPAKDAESAEGEVSGFVMERLDLPSKMPSISGAPLMGIILVLFILIVIGAGFRRK